MSAKATFPNEAGSDGSFQRQDDAFRNRVSRDGSTPHPADPERYHLYISLACPWAHRALLFLKFCSLEGRIGYTVVDPVRDDKGWAFRDGDGFSSDPVEGFSTLAEAYRATDPDYNDRVTVPVLWDKQERKIVNNSEDDLCRMFNQVFTDGSPDFFPDDRSREQEALSHAVYEEVNNGVYRAGFATSQSAYEEAVECLFNRLDTLERLLADGRPYLLGEAEVETDWRLFCTLVRFDPVYVGHFKCNLRRIADYPYLSAYLKRLYRQPGVAETVRLDHIKAHYYRTHPEINPTGIVPVGPVLDWD